MTEEPDAQPGAHPGAEPVWLSVKRAARALGVSEQAVRRRIKRGTIETRREVVGNQARVLVRVERHVERLKEQPGAEPGADPGAQPDRAVVALLEAAVERLERDNADLRGERDRLLALLEAALAERRPERRRWPGLRRWWRQFVEGEG